VSGVLGCAQDYAVQVTTRGGHTAVGMLDNITGVQWDRKFNAVGTAVVTMAQGVVTAQCCRLMNLITQDNAYGAYEAHVYRDAEQVWCGPIARVSETVSATNRAFTVTAGDVLTYLDGHALPVGYNLTDDVVEIAQTILSTDLVTDDPSLLANMVFTSGGTAVSRAAGRASATLLAELQALTQLGLRFTTCVRTIYFGGSQGVPFGAPIALTLDDVAGAVTVEFDAASYANTVFGRSGTAAPQIPTGQVPPDDPQMVTIGGPEPGWRGRSEMIVSPMGGSSGQPAVVSAAQAAYFAAQRPRVLRVADNSVLSPDATVAVSDLICGSVVRLAGREDFCTWRDQDLQLMRVSGTFGNAGEQIGISLGPVS